MKIDTWFPLRHPENVISPSLLIYPDRIRHNINLMLKMVGDPKKLRPHVKTHKTAEIIQMQMEVGIHKFKCATIAEAELLGNCGAKDVLLALQPVGKNIARLATLIKKFPKTHFSTLVDNSKTLAELADCAKTNGVTLSLYIDLNIGMNRTGIAPRTEALELYRAINDHPNLHPEGLHAYDGHLRNPDPAVRKEDCDLAFEKVAALKERILSENLPEPIIVVGGSPTFPYHAKRKNVIASPGTTLLWDAGYGGQFPEMEFLPAAVLHTRIISKPKAGLLCFDLGHKSIAPEMPFPRVKFLTLDHGKQVSQSEEHLVVEYDDLKILQVGSSHYAIPMHICPTVAKYAELLVIGNGEVIDSWNVVARDHKLTI